MKDCFLGIDIGTGSSKGALVDISGNVLASASIAHSMSTPASGWYEQNADDIWWYDFVFLAQALVEKLHKLSIPKECIRSVALSTIAPCVLPVDIKGKPLRPGILYGIDTRATQEIKEIEQNVGKDNIFRMTGQHLSSQSCTPKIRWIQKHEPAVWEKTHKVLTASGYLVYRLTGNYTIDMYNAIGYAPIFNIRQKCWDKTYAEGILDLSVLPEIYWSNKCCGFINKKAKEETNLPLGIPVITGTADAAAESLAAGVKSVGDMMMMYGSSNFFIVKTRELRPVPYFWASNFLEADTTVLTGGMATVGSMFKWLSDSFPGRTYAEWEQLAKTSKAGANRVTILPYFAGERTPLFNPDARGVIFGLSLTTTPGDLYKAFQESVGFGIRHNIEILKKAGESPERIIAIGGATASSDMMQGISDITGCRQELPKQRLGACYGDAFLAAVGSGYIDSLENVNLWVEIEKEFIPNPALVQQYNEAYYRFRKLYESTKSLLVSQ